MTRPAVALMTVLAATCSPQPAAIPDPEPPAPAALPTGSGHDFPSLLRGDGRTVAQEVQSAPGPRSHAQTLPANSSEDGGQPDPEPDPDPWPIEPPGPYDGIADYWLELARCESGNWVDGGASFTGPIRWNWGAPGMDLPPWGTDLHHGGLQWNPDTWDWLAPDVLGDNAPARAYGATPAQEVAVAEHYVALEQAAGRGGWGLWPTCGPLVGLPR